MRVHTIVVWPWIAHLWRMSSNHSAVVQSAASVISVLLLIATVIYTIRAFRAAGRQAEAAENAANMSIMQLAYSVQSDDRQHRPILVFADIGPTSAKIINKGLGPALKIRVTYHRQQIAITCRTDVLGVGDNTEINFEEHKAGIWGLRVRYESVYERPHQCICELGSGSLDFEQRHVDKPAKIDQLFDLHFKPWK